MQLSVTSGHEALVPQSARATAFFHASECSRNMSHQHDTNSGVPFVLRARTRLAETAAPGGVHIYDQALQLWVSAQSGRPVVLEYAERRRKRLEGAQAERNAALRAS